MKEGGRVGGLGGSVCFVFPSRKERKGDVVWRACLGQGVGGALWGRAKPVIMDRKAFSISSFEDGRGEKIARTREAIFTQRLMEDCFSCLLFFFPSSFSFLLLVCNDASDVYSEQYPPISVIFSLPPSSAMVSRCRYQHFDHIFLKISGNRQMRAVYMGEKGRKQTRCLLEEVRSSPTHAYINAFLIDLHFQWLFISFPPPSAGLALVFRGRQSKGLMICRGDKAWRMQPMSAQILIFGPFARFAGLLRRSIVMPASLLRFLIILRCPSD